MGASPIFMAPRLDGCRVKGCFPKDICHVFALGQWDLSRFSKCGEKSELAKRNPIFGNKTADCGSAKPESG